MLSAQLQCGMILYMDEYAQQATARMFGVSVKQARERRAWSQSELARQMNDAGWPKYSQVAVSRTEDGTRAVRLDEALAIATVLGLQLEDLLVLGQEERDLKQSMDMYSASGGILEADVKRAEEMRLLLRQDIEAAKDQIESSALSDTAKSRLERLIEQAQELLVGDLLYFVNRALVPRGSMFPYVDRQSVRNERAGNGKHQEEA